MAFVVKEPPRSSFDIQVDIMRARTALAYKEVARLKNVPTPLLDLLNTMLQRLDDLEMRSGYFPVSGSTSASDLTKIDTQGR